jgi:GNAT superfamily N-acetyltransferase
MIEQQPTIIKPATPRDLPFIEDLSNRFSYELGFVPRIAMENRIEGRRGGGVLLARVNGQEGGFLHYGSLRREECRLFQAAIDYDLQRQQHGLALVSRFVDLVDAVGVRLITLRCLSSLDANRFWTAAGFRRCGVERGARGPLYVWAKRLHVADDLLTGRMLPPVPRRARTCRGCGKPCTYTRGPKGQLWRMCGACVERHAANAITTVQSDTMNNDRFFRPATPPAVRRGKLCGS